jgi:hypothetical protein
MNFPGNNTIVLCERALIEIIEDSINMGRTIDGEQVTVKTIQYRDHQFHITVTTDKE